MNNQQFIARFNLDPATYTEITPFIDDSIGFSVSKQYPPNIAFVPVKMRDGSDDSFILIRIAFYPAQVVKNKVPLLADVSKASRYLANHFVYNFEDTASPTKEAVIASEKSKQPTSLDTSARFVFDVATEKIWDSEAKKEISGRELVDYLYKLHLKSIDHIPFRAKLKLKQHGFNLHDKVFPYLQKVLSVLGWEFYRERNDLGLGIYKLYVFAVNFRRKEEDKINFLGIPVPRIAAVISAIIILGFVITNYVWKYDPLSITAFMRDAVAVNQIFIFAFSVTLIYGIDFILPRLVFSIINLTVKIRLWSSTPTRLD